METVAPDVREVKRGDRVAYLGRLGSYAEFQHRAGRGGDPAS